MLTWFKQIDVPRTFSGHLGIVSILILAQISFKSIFALDLDVGIYPPIAETIRHTLATNPWALLLPMEYEPTRFYWPVTTLLPLFALQEIMPAFVVFLLISSLQVGVIYSCSLLVSRSIVFSISMGVIAGFGTQLLYAYSIHNLFGIYFYLCYFSLSLTAGYFLVTRPDKTLQRLCLYTVALITAALGWEQWVNYGVWVIVAGTLALAWNQHHHGPLVSKHILGAVAITAAVLCIYLIIRMPAAREYMHAGSEEELIFSYSSYTMMIDDFISSFFTYIYTAFSNFLPPSLVTSGTIQKYGFEAIVAEQNGYHEPYQHLVPMHHLFYWRYYAGITTTLFLLFTWRSLARSWKSPDIQHLVYVMLALMVLAGFGVHMLVKYRPYLSVPALPYKTTMSVYAISVLIAYTLMTARTWIRHLNAYYALVWGVWFLIIYEAFTRPKMLASLLKHVGLTGKTDPAEIISKILFF